MKIPATASGHLNEAEAGRTDIETLLQHSARTQNARMIHARTHKRARARAYTQT